MNRAFKIILEKATADARDPRILAALDDIYTKLLVVPLQRAFAQRMTTQRESATDSTLEHTCVDCKITHDVSFYNKVGRQPCFDCRQRDRYMSEAD
jgi:hypothetical protein